MKKYVSVFLAALLILTALAGCQKAPSDPGTPPEEVIHPSGHEQTNPPANSGEILENAVSVRIGRDSRDELAVNMIDNAAVGTILGYLSGEALLFPTYTYDEEAGFVAQNIRGSYTRDDEVNVADVKCGELYLFSGGQLRLYFKDVPGANITATPVGTFADASVVTEAVKQAYESNRDDTWGVEVYFWITKNEGK